MVNINIRCPKCKQNRILTLDEKKIVFRQSGLFSINIEKNFTCEHSYITYIDQQYNIRDYFDFDYNIELPVTLQKEERKENIDTSLLAIDYDLIKLNLTANILVIALKAILSKKSCVFIEEEDLFLDYIIQSFEEICRNSFEFDVKIISKDIYKSSKSKFKNSVILNGSSIINNPYKFDIKKMKVEKRIINTFMSEMDIIKAINILRSHIKNAFDLAKIVCNYKVNHSKEKHIYAKNIIDFLENSYKITISSQYLDFLIEIANNYFEIPIKLSIPHYTGVF